MRRIIGKAAHYAERICGGIAVLSIALLLAVVAANIGARAIFDLSGTRINFLVPGAIEQAKFALLIAVFAAFPPSIKTALVSVDFLVEKLPKRLQKYAERLWFFVLFLFAVILVWLFGEEALTLFERGDTTQDIHVPLFIFYVIIALECAALALVSLREVLAIQPEPGGAF